MSNVSAIDGVKYGFRLMGYLIAVYIGAAIIIAIGFAIAEDGSAGLGGIIILLGGLTLFAGLLGMGYKVIADGVEKGVNAANGRVDDE